MKNYKMKKEKYRLVFLLKAISDKYYNVFYHFSLFIYYFPLYSPNIFSSLVRGMIASID